MLAKMPIRNILFRLFFILVLSITLYIFLNLFSPYKEDGSLNPLMILAIFSILAVLLFLFLQTILLPLKKPHLSNAIAFIGSFAFVQIVLIKSGGFLDLNSLIGILLFNFFIFWYAVKIL